MATSRITAVIEPLPSRERLEAMWRALEARADASFFLSWTWVGCWLAETGARPMLLRIERAGAVVGLALLCQVRKTRRGMRLPTLVLNETGDPAFDMIAIEENGVLLDRDQPDELLEAAIEAILEASRARSETHWDEVILSGVTETVFGAVRTRAARLRMIDRKPAPFVDLTPLRGASGKALDRYLATLSRNSRQQVRRALRLYQTAGPVRLEPARDVGEALSFLEAMAEPHQARWTALGRPGAFASSFFLRFHNTLIVEGFPRREVALFRVAAGSRPLGYLYCFTHRGTAYAYQNGFFYEADSRYKPGLVAHALAVERFAEDGFGRYDFLAGEAQYKRSLATGSRDLYWLAMQSRRPGLLIEAAVRKLWAATRGPLRQAARGRGRRSGHPGSVAP